MRQIAVAVAICLSALAFTPSNAAAEMGPCSPDGQDNLICGSGDGAARVIAKTQSPSGRLALAWRLTDRPPSSRPHDDNESYLENLLVRIKDGVILAKSRGAYWNTAERTAKAFAYAAWLPNSRLMVWEVVPNEGPIAAELFALDDHDAVTGPFDLVKALDPTVRAQMKGVKDVNPYVMRFSYKPEPTIDDQGLVHASVYMEVPGSDDGPMYGLTAQVTNDGASLDVKVLSVSQYLGPYISVTIH